MSQARGARGALMVVLRSVGGCVDTIRYVPP
jgi:hypothetical protein